MHDQYGYMFDVIYWNLAKVLPYSLIEETKLLIDNNSSNTNNNMRTPTNGPQSNSKMDRRRSNEPKARLELRKTDRQV